jgi:hypothetical protein
MNQEKADRHLGPPLGVLAIIYAILFNLGLYFVVTFSAGQPHYPGPWESADVIASYFRDHASEVLLCAFFQFGSVIPLFPSLPSAEPSFED